MVILQIQDTMITSNNLKQSKIISLKILSNINNVTNFIIIIAHILQINLDGLIENIEVQITKYLYELYLLLKTVPNQC